MAISGVAQARNRIDEIVNSTTMDNFEKAVALDRVKRYLNQKISDVAALIAANPPSATNVPNSYILCDAQGKPFAKFEDGAIVAL